MGTQRMLSIRAALVAAVLLGAAPARAGGFLIYDVSGEAVAKGSAVVASSTAPDAVWYNPAGIAFGAPYQFSLGTVYTTADSTFRPKGGGKDVGSIPGNYFLPHLFASVRAADWLYVGVGGYSVYGLGVEWPQDWVGRVSTITSALTTATINPTLTFKPHKDLAIGIGFDAVRGALDATQGLPEPIGGTARFGAAGWGYGANVGVLWRAIPDKLSVGVTWRSRITLVMDGRIDIAPRPEFLRDLPGGKVHTELTLPDIVAFGVSFRPVPEVELGVDANIIAWSTYDKTVLKRDNAADIVMDHGWTDALVLRVGVDWATPVKGLNVRAGLIYDKTPVPDEVLEPSTPDADQIDVCLGLGYQWKWLKADLGYQLIAFLPHEAATGRLGPEGTYRTLGHFLALTMTFRFGEPAVRPLGASATP
jgi:long-chain fatty acid transport protein